MRSDLRPALRGFTAVALSLLLFAPAASAQARPSSYSAPAAHAQSLASTATPVLFSLDLLPIGSLDVTLHFGTNCTLSGGEITPGESVTADASLSLPSSIQLGITYNGVGTSVPVAAVGNSFDVPVPGLGITYLGFTLGVLLNFSSEVTATSSVHGPGSGGGGSLAWTASQTHTFRISANTSAAPGSTITSILGNIQYSVSMGLDAGAVLPVVGLYVVHLLKFGSLGLVPGNPSSVESTYGVPAAPTGGAAAAAGSETELLIGAFGVAAIVAAIVVTVLWRRRSRK